MQNSTYDPSNRDQFDKTKLNLSIQGVMRSFIALGSCTMDLKLNDDYLITGASVNVKGVAFGDKITMRVVDVDGVYAPAGTVLNEFVTNFYLEETSQKQLDFECEYPAKIKAGLYLRIVYDSVGLSVGQVASNYILHKVLA